MLAVLLGLFVVMLAVRSAMAKRPADLGLVEGRLRPCPASPNCVCSQDADEAHKIEPLVFAGPPEEAMAKLKAAIEKMSRARVVTAEGNYLHAEFTSLIFRFVDDVEFSLDPENKQIHVRSASRTGYSDLGVNRRRVESIRETFGGK